MSASIFADTYLILIAASVGGHDATLTIIPSEVLKHVSPLSWEHINLTGTYAWGEQPVLVDGFPLRLPQALARAA